MKGTQKRCEWAESHPIYITYHDTEWGVPLHHDRKLFEFLMLEGAQAGLSWLTVLKKRQNYRKAFSGFDPRMVARYTKKDFNRLMKDAGIIRNRLKIRAAIQNAKAFLAIQKEFGRFDTYIWVFVGNKPKVNKFKNMKQIPAVTSVSDAISKDLKKREFSFVGSTIVYAHMQATGMVNDHMTSCFRYQQVQRIK